MSDSSTPLPSGMRVRHIQTIIVGKDAKTGKDIVVPVLDDEGKEIEIYSVDVPLHIEGADGTPEERQAAIDAFVADAQASAARQSQHEVQPGGQR